MSWVTVSLNDFGEDKKTYSFEQHSTGTIKGMPWAYCKSCGLVYFKNRFTKWCIKKGCNHELHPQYKHILKKETRR